MINYLQLAAHTIKKPMYYCVFEYETRVWRVTVIP